MDYQASTSSSKVKKIQEKKKHFVLFLLLSFSVPSVFAQLAPNPLYESVTMRAAVLVGPGTHPDTPPLPPPSPTPTIDTTDAVIFKGISYPGSTISLLQNGTVIAAMPASPNGTFEMRVRNLAAGTYSFGIRAEDSEKLKSKLLLFTVYVSSGITTVIDGIFIPPTITSDKVEVKRGEIVTFLGKSVPGADVRLSFHSDVEILKKTKANASGTWMYKLDSSELELGDHEGKARSLIPDDLSPYSESLPFRVGDTSRLRSKVSTLVGFRKRCDLNNDERVNLLDFSIMAYWYKRLGFPAKVDLNTDNKVNLTDLSILAYCWTG